MNLIWSAVWQVVSSCLPVFLLIFLGWFCVQQKIFTKDSKKLLSGLVSNFVFPALLFVHTAHAKPSEIFNGIWMIAFFCTMSFLWIICFLTNKYLLGKDLKSTTMNSMLCCFPNMGGMGVPFLTLMLGASSTISVAIANFVVALSLIPMTIFLLELCHTKVSGGKVTGNMIFSAVKNSLMKPMFLAVILGLIVSVTNGLTWMPHFVFNTFDIMSNACNFISLIAVGVGIYGVQLNLSKLLVVNVLLKSFVTPVVALIAVHLFGLKGIEAEELVFLLAMPTASTAVILAYDWEVEQEHASSIFFASTILSIFILPTLLLIMEFTIPGVH
ncbi:MULTISPECIES: AEC family transporter [unclassified Gilliamella]|uniref:AEC family transporter n=1 Tax=unclassified Gilliamella TaxID=2685620 RepID=UPI002269FE3E|nr:MULTISPECIES: AEC family transporter [unclassified Gilliamella]MCX8642436.1 AEC family transporter [Gilliamella sp. B3835]MCX8706286.1 AEC family transporter [Gilliamella sp. B3783]MCX8709408.1 AEC family transporter [Gilliamella sp. B3780]MCX8712072.1 AEC family transporter [Gilliamella sp. B3468]MCX8714303.1 AEC family transporter [Gilliamella sp. B3781]